MHPARHSTDQDAAGTASVETPGLRHDYAGTDLADLPPQALMRVDRLLRDAELEPGQSLSSLPQSALWLVLEGAVEAVEAVPDGGSRCVRLLVQGEVVDHMQKVTGHLCPVELLAKTRARIAWLDRSALDRCIAGESSIQSFIRGLHQRELLCRLSTVFGTFDRALLDLVSSVAQWRTLARDTTLQPAPDEVIHLVVSGRVQALRHVDGTPIEEASRGDVIGERDLATQHQVDYALHALRRSMLVSLVRQDIENIICARPELLWALMKLLADPALSGKNRPGAMTNIAVVSCDGVDIAPFVRQLTQAMMPHGKTELVSSREAREFFAMSRAGDDNELYDEVMLAWLEIHELSNRFVVYECDPTPTPWTQRCLQVADRILVLANAGGDPQPTQMERELLGSLGADSHESLVLVHPPGTTRPRGTRRWLAARPAFEDHYHIIDGDADDIARVARFMAGQAVGLVLGGGGARCFSQIGVIRALREHGIPIDMVGGTSMGASIAALHAMGMSPDELVNLNETVWTRMRPHRKYTIPFFSITGNAHYQRCGQMLYGDADIEDCWLPYFCVSSNITNAELRVHKSGSLLRASMASACLPGFVAPVVEDQMLLVDGGLLNNLPADVMRSEGCGVVISVSVSDFATTNATFAADTVPSLFSALRGRFNAASRPRFPSLLETILRSTMLTSIQKERSAAQQSDACLYPPMNGVSLMDFDRIHEICDIGYRYACQQVPRMRLPGITIAGLESAQNETVVAD